MVEAMKPVEYGHRAPPAQYPPASAPISTVPANSNAAGDEFNPSAADFMAGKIEWECRSSIRDLVSLYGENADRLVSDYLKDAKERKRS